MYYNAFLQRYLPYRELFFAKMFRGVDLAAEAIDDAHRVAEDAARLAVGLPRIGQKWISETMLFRIVRSLVAPREVIHHYRGQELQGQEIDIWVPSLKLAVEYHGMQHFRPVAMFGGEKGLAATRERDKRKQALLKALGYNLIEFAYDQQFSEDSVLEKLKPFIGISDETLGT